MERLDRATEHTTDKLFLKLKKKSTNKTEIVHTQTVDVSHCV